VGSIRVISSALRPPKLRSAGREAGRLALAFVGALTVFGAFVIAKGANPLTVYSDMVRSTFFNSNSVAGVLVKACPLILAALAVAVPARAGLVNVGGEGRSSSERWPPAGWDLRSTPTCPVAWSSS